MFNSIKAGLGFGLTSGVITTLGLIVGLDSVTGSQLAVIGGILTIAIADSFSDALGIHVSEESKKDTTHLAVWKATLSTFFTKIIISLTFLIPVLSLELNTAIIASILWGFLLISIFSYTIAKSRKENPFYAIIEHLTIAIAVVIITSFIGKLI